MKNTKQPSSKSSYFSPNFAKITLVVRYKALSYSAMQLKLQYQL